MHLLIFLLIRLPRFFFFFFFNDTATTEIYTLSLHDALPIFHLELVELEVRQPTVLRKLPDRKIDASDERSEEHTSELQSPCNLVCRLLLEKKKIIKTNTALGQS